MLILDGLNLTYNLKYWCTKNKVGVDFVIEKERDVYPIKIKYVSKIIVGNFFIYKLKLKVE